VELAESGDLVNYSVAVAKVDSIAPVARMSQLLLLDPHEELPANSDLAIIETETCSRYLRQLWHEPNGGLHLTATNSTANISPVFVRAGECRSRRVVGVLFERMRNVSVGRSGDEWACLPSIPATLLKDLMGIRVVGTSLEPIARDGQIVLARTAQP